MKVPVGIYSDPYLNKQPLAPFVHFLYLPCGRVGLGATSRRVSFLVNL